MEEKLTILIADDMEFTRGILKMLLHSNYNVLEAANGEEALSVLDKHGDEISCVLLDIRMPGVDGYEVMDCMRRKGFMERVPVIALTAMSDPKGHIRCYESGAIDIIEKPYNEELLLYKIKWAIGRFRRFVQERGISVSPAPLLEAGSTMPKLLQEVADHCRRHFNINDEDEVQSMIGSFLRTFDRCAARLQEQEEEPDFMEVRDVGHDLSGFAAESGATELADLTLALRICAKVCDAESTMAMIRRILVLHHACHS